jgi:hypothetical protein
MIAVQDRDWLRTTVWTFLLLYMVGAVVVGLYFAARAIAGATDPPKVVCTQPKTSGGVDWGASSISCESR